jgi:hypothetical protein
MRKFLVASCLSLLSLYAAAAEDSPLIAGLKAFRAPMEQLVGEAGKGRQANGEIVDKAAAEVDAAWKLATSEAIDFERYAVAEAQQDDTRRQVRLLDMLLTHMGDAQKRGDRSLILRAAERMPEPYGKLSASVGLR